MPKSVADGLAAALPFLMARRGRRVVVKLGGSTLDDPDALSATLQDLVLLQFFGQNVVVVHGGGKAIDRALQQAGIEPKKIDGRRVTDEMTLGIVFRVLDHDINPAIVQQIKRLGGFALGWSHHLKAVATDRALGYVGRVSEVDVAAIQQVLAADHMVVLPSLGFTIDGQLLNINADDAATAVAAQWPADIVIFLTDTPGLLRDCQDPSSLIRRIDSAEAQRLIDAHIIDGGMVPKVQGCLEALSRGVNKVQILDGRVHHALLMESLTGECTGTEFVK